MTAWDAGLPAGLHAGRIMVLAAAGVLALTALVAGLAWLLDAGDFLDAGEEGEGREEP